MTYVFDVVGAALLHPIPARIGDSIIVCPGCDVAPLATVRRINGEWRVVHVGPPNYGALLGPLVDGVIRPHSDVDAAFLERVAA